MTGYRQQKPKNGLTKCPDLVDHYTTHYLKNYLGWRRMLERYGRGVNIKACLHEALGHPMQHVIGT
ncbi:hypothetical protein A9G49_03665 [Aeromonas sp. ANP5]|nr:hypothetical protein A9G04_03920 [Aeromonas sp. ANNP30]OEC66706.1 hypothetical protein A9G49_03665 [Aeromonas sp. ANP5]